MIFPNLNPEWFGVPGLIAIIAVTHVFVSHFAVGGGLYLVTTERWGHRIGRPGIVRHAERHTRFFVLLTLVFGALSGVGIWFAVGLASPDGIYLLIRTFVWGWAAEWCFFLIELSAAIVYYKTWHKLSSRDHMRVGWLYALASIVTLLIINGILSFMITPGRWIETRNFWDGLFNPSYLPTTVMRIGACVFVAGCFALVTSRREGDRDAQLLLARGGRWIAAGLLISLVGLFWARATFPASVRDLISRSMSGATGGIPLLKTLWWSGGGALLMLLFAGLMLAMRKPKRLARGWVWALVALAFYGFGSAEYVREMLRKPFVVRDVIYANGIYVDDIARFRGSEGFLRHTPDAAVLSTHDPRRIGEAMFRRQCSVCHTKTGYRAIDDLTQGWGKNKLGVFIRSLAKQQPGVPTIWSTMPPLVGNEAEINALRAWLEHRAGAK